MTTRNLAAAVVAAALGVLVLGAAVAPAAVTVRTDPGGALLTGPTTLRNTTSDVAAISTPAGNLTCTQASFDAHLTANVSSSIIGGGLTALTLTACSDTLPTVNIEECALHAPADVRLTSTAGGGDFTVIDPTIRCKLVSQNVACYYTFGALRGFLGNSPSALTFTSIAVTTVTATADALSTTLCGNGGQFSVAFTHIVDNGSRTITVTSS
jgi:hypothetical protein